MNTKEFHQMLVEDGWLPPDDANELQQAKDELIALVESLKIALLEIATYEGNDAFKLKLFAMTVSGSQGKDWLPHLKANAIKEAIEKTGQPMQFIDLNAYPLPPRVCLAADLYQLARELDQQGEAKHD